MASKTINSLVTFVPITKYVLGINTFDVLRVNVRYDKGYGFRAGYTPGWGGEHCWGCCIDGSDNPLTAGFMVTVEPASRNDAKRLMEIIGNLGKAKDIIAALFDDREWVKLKGVLQNAGRFGYTDGFKEQAEKYLAERVSKRYEKAIKPIEPVVKQVDVMGLMGALQTKGKAKLSDFAKPIESTNENENQNEKAMATNVKGADLIGKVIIMGTTGAKYIVKSVAEDKLMCDFENPTAGLSQKNMPVPFANVQKFINEGKWTVADANEAAAPAAEIKTEADVAEVDDIVPVVTKKEKTHPQPLPVSEGSGQTATTIDIKPETKPKAKTNTDKTDSTDKGAKYAYATYQTKKGKTGAKITGFASEEDVFYAMAAQIHASGSYERDKDGNKKYYLCFGPRYAEAAKSICKVLNSDKTVNQKVEECKLIVSQATEELATKREEWKQKREERKAEKANAESKPKAEGKQEKTYTQTELAEWLRKLNAGDPKAAKFFNDLAKAA